MDQITGLLNLTVTAWEESLLRIVLAMLFGFVLGIERDMKQKPIGVRPYMIVALTTCVMAMAGMELEARYTGGDGVVSVDLAKIIAGVLGGIGFLGAGAIIRREGTHLVGAATGASIWAAGGLGLVVGFGFYLLALMAVVGIALILFVGGHAKESIDDEPEAES